MTDRQRFGEPRSHEVFAEDEWSALHAAVSAGIGAIQIREKDLDGGALFARAVELVSLRGRAGPRVLINDRADIARAAGAHGVHLPGAGLPAESARTILGAEALVGRSIHSLDEARDSTSVDYFVFGPIFETPSKRRYGAPQGLGRLAEVSRASAIPVIAIGGITVSRAAEVLRHGACGVAVMGAVLSADDPAAEVRAFKEVLGGL